MLCSKASKRAPNVCTAEANAGNTDHSASCDVSTVLNDLYIANLFFVILSIRLIVVSRNSVLAIGTLLLACVNVLPERVKLAFGNKEIVPENTG
jgi:hypothetical protein